MSKYINRTMENLLNELIDKYPVITITGPRQVGKSTLLEYIIKNKKKEITYVTLDDMFLRASANEDPLLFLYNYNTPLIIDEFQYAPNLLSYIKINVDEARKKALFDDGPEETLYYLTGSQIFESMKDLSDSLAGRVAILDLYGLSTRELYKLEENVFIPDINEIKKEDLAKYFIEFRPYINECEYVDCSHIKEEKCGVKNALEDGKISKERYERYIVLYKKLNIFSANNKNNR